MMRKGVNNDDKRFVRADGSPMTHITVAVGGVLQWYALREKPHVVGLQLASKAKEPPECQNIEQVGLNMP